MISGIESCMPFEAEGLAHGRFETADRGRPGLTASRQSQSFFMGSRSGQP